MKRPHPTHESSAVDVSRLHAIAAILAGSLIAIVLAMYGLWHAWLQPMPHVHNDVIPPAPRLQADPAPDLAVLRAREQARLDGYAWIDRKAGIARIPLDRAMALLLEQQGATRAAGAPAPAETR